MKMVHLRRSRRAGMINLWRFLFSGLLVTMMTLLYEAGTTLEGLHKTAQFDPVQSYVNHNESLDDGGNTSLLWDDKTGIADATDPDTSDADTTPPSNLDEGHLNSEMVRDKGPLLQLLREAGMDDLDEATLKALPTWSNVTDLYGKEPVLHGFPEECSKFQSLPNPSLHFIASAGSFNSGTNLMAELLIHNCHLPQHEGGPGVRWQVLWGKHTPIANDTFRLEHKTYSDEKYKVPENVFPVVMVRDPYQWMQALCRHHYTATWPVDPHDPEHCPNLVRQVAQAGVTKETSHFDTTNSQTTYKVTVVYPNVTTHHASMAEFWNDWYRPYTEALFPRLMVRYEDLLYHPRTVVQQACECAGGKLKARFEYITKSAKKGLGGHGKERTSYLDALIRYGSEQGRYKGFSSADLDYLATHLDRTMMQNMGYSFHSTHKPEQPQLPL